MVATAQLGEHPLKYKAKIQYRHYAIIAGKPIFSFKYNLEYPSTGFHYKWNAKKV
jgi:hypothetical protein